MNKKAYFGGGCFWCLEAGFRMVRGVKEVISGYAGGSVPNPSYEQVCDGSTGHAEIVEIEYNPEEVSYTDLLKVFFTVHDPTTLNRQGHDVGTQYRSVIFTQDDAEYTVAQEVINELNAEGIFAQPIVTEVTPLDTFYPAEEYHQKYYKKNPDAAYCQIVIAPKLSKLKKEVSELLNA